MQRKFYPLIAMACAVLAVAVISPALALSLAPLLLLGMLPLVSASRDYPPTALADRRVPRWLDVVLYRLLSFGAGLRRGLGAVLFAFQTRAGLIAMAFPGTVTTDLAFGVVGSRAFDGPYRAQPGVINWATAADIAIGRWFTVAADGTFRPGGAGAVGGVFMHPKVQAALGTAAGTLVPTLIVPTGTIGEFAYMGTIVVALGAAVAIGDAGKYNTTTGVILSGAPGAGEAAIPNSKFVRYANAAAGLAVLELTN